MCSVFVNAKKRFVEVSRGVDGEGPKVVSPLKVLPGRVLPIGSNISQKE
tara:strand:+ start:8884 stop:9030 length:147 start_codon:yes stop_codon:yes gene_type:complete